MLLPKFSNRTLSLILRLFRSTRNSFCIRWNQPSEWCSSSFKWIHDALLFYRVSHFTTKISLSIPSFKFLSCRCRDTSPERLFVLSFYRIDQSKRCSSGNDVHNEVFFQACCTANKTSYWTWTLLFFWNDILCWCRWMCSYLMHWHTRIWIIDLESLFYFIIKPL